MAKVCAFVVYGVRGSANSKAISHEDLNNNTHENKITFTNTLSHNIYMYYIMYQRHEQRAITISIIEQNQHYTLRG